MIFELNILPLLYKHNPSLGQERFWILFPRLIYTEVLTSTHWCSFCTCATPTSYQTWLLSSHLLSYLIIMSIKIHVSLKHFQIMFSTSPSTSFHVFVCSSTEMTPFLDAVVPLLKLLPTQCCSTLRLLYSHLQAHCWNTTYVTNAFHLHILSILYDTCTHYLNTAFLQNTMLKMFSHFAWLLKYLYTEAPRFLMYNTDSSVGTVTDYELDEWGSIPGRHKRFFSFQVSRLALTQPPTEWIVGIPSCPGVVVVERRGHEAYHSPPSSGELKNGRTILHLPHISLWCDS